MPMRTVSFADSTSNKDRSIPPSRHVPSSVRVQAVIATLRRVLVMVS